MYAEEVRAWWAYWVSITFAAVLWLGALLLLGRSSLRSILGNPMGLTVFVAPLVVAGVDLILFRATHEEICRLEARRHRWLRSLVGQGYSAAAFLWSGVAVLVVAIVIVTTVAMAA